MRHRLQEILLPRDHERIRLVTGRTFHDGRFNVRLPDVWDAVDEHLFLSHFLSHLNLHDIFYDKSWGLSAPEPGYLFRRALGARRFFGSRSSSQASSSL